MLIYTSRFIDRKFYLYYIFTAGYINDIIIFSDIAMDYFKYLKIIFKFFEEIDFNITLTKLFVVYPSVRLLNYYINTLRIVIIIDYILTI